MRPSDKGWPFNLPLQTARKTVSSLVVKQRIELMDEATRLNLQLGASYYCQHVKERVKFALLQLITN